MPLIREAVVAGQFYPGTKAALTKTLSELTQKCERGNALGAMVPHAGYVYSGAVAGKVMSRIAPRGLYVILGPNHTGKGNPFSVFLRGAWKTPLGAIDIDEKFADALISRSDIFKSDESAHTFEHSIEVQVPFLQYLVGSFKIVPIVIGSMEMPLLKKAGVEIAETMKALGAEAVIIASSDMTHYESQQAAQKKDKEALSAILSMDEDGLAEKVSRMDISMCGVAPVIVMLSAVKYLGAKKAELVEYKTSGDSSGDYSSVVGYGGVLIK